MYATIQPLRAVVILLNKAIYPKVYCYLTVGQSDRQVVSRYVC